MILNETTQYPRKRAEKLTVQLVGAETLIYNETTHHAHCLDEVASAVWQQIDGRTSVEQIAASASLQLGVDVTEDAVLLTLNQLESDGLIEALAEPVPAALLSRRRAMQLGVGVGMALPLIATIVAPKAAQAYNGCVDC